MERRGESSTAVSNIMLNVFWFSNCIYLIEGKVKEQGNYSRRAVFTGSGCSGQLPGMNTCSKGRHVSVIFTITVILQFISCE